jgi:hypothetical protein
MVSGGDAGFAASSPSEQKGDSGDSFSVLWPARQTSFSRVSIAGIRFPVIKGVQNIYQEVETPKGCRKEPPFECRATPTAARRLQMSLLSHEGFVPV